MNFIKQISPLLAQGVQLTLLLKQDGDKVNLAFLPSGKENKAGIVVPTQALLGTAEELDTNLEEWLAKYVGTCLRITSIAGNTDAALKAAEEQAQAEATKALEARKANKTTTNRPSPSKPARKPVSLGTEGSTGSEDEERDDGGGDTGSDASTTLDTATPPAESPAPAPAGESVLTPDLF